MPSSLGTTLGYTKSCHGTGIINSLHASRFASANATCPLSTSRRLSVLLTYSDGCSSPAAGRRRRRSFYSNFDWLNPTKRTNGPNGRTDLSRIPPLPTAGPQDGTGRSLQKRYVLKPTGALSTLPILSLPYQQVPLLLCFEEPHAGPVRRHHVLLNSTVA